MTKGHKIRVDTSGMDAKLLRAATVLPDMSRRIIKRGTLQAVRLMAQEAPVGKTHLGHVGGRLREDIGPEFSNNGLTGIAGPQTVNYAQYVVHGTSASPGRYVPAIGKRLVNPPNGMHPGIKANDFPGRAADKLLPILQAIERDEMAQAISAING